jgi:hypothetical protein
METLAYFLSSAAFFLWIAAIAAALIAVPNSQRDSQSAKQRETDSPSAGYRWQFE